ncbi:hypothetical protein [Methanosarcina horonobensis]|nr:hypothetical protein [Methanosarcina horonobensis]
MGDFLQRVLGDVATDLTRESGSLLESNVNTDVEKYTVQTVNKKAA